MKNRILLPLIFCFGLVLNAKSQELLTLEQAIATGLKNNFSILLSKNNLEVAKNDYTSGNAGLLPVVTATGSYVNTTSNTHQ
jgi:outer membrane protein TolC